MADELAAVVMAAGIGTRMKSATPKHLHPILGRRMVDWVVDAAREAGVERIVVVASPQTSDVLEGVEVAVQETPLGTGDAVRCARSALEGFGGDVLVLNGDVPALRPETIRTLVETHREAGAAATVLSFEPADAGAYGRIVRDDTGRLARIVEAADASPEELALGEVNSGIYVFKADQLWPALERLDPHNAQGELYVTDTLGLLVADGEPCAVQLADDPLEAEGVNTRVELALAAASLRDRINEEHMLAGVTIVDPATTWIEAHVEIEPDVVVHPFTVIRGGVRIEGRAEIGPFAYVRRGERDRRGREDRHLRRGQERGGRRGREDPAPLLRRRRRGGRRDERRGRQHHRQLPARARRAKGPDEDRPQRQDRRGHCLRCPGRDRRRRLDCSGDRHHG